MSKKPSPRAKFIAKAQDKELAAFVWDIGQLAMHHDPEHAKELEALDNRVAVLERQVERLGAPQYRTIKKGKAA